MARKSTPEAFVEEDLFETGATEDLGMVFRELHPDGSSMQRRRANAPARQRIEELREQKRLRGLTREVYDD